MEGQRASRRGSQQHGPAAIAELDARLRAMEVDRDGLGQELQRSQMVLRLLQSSLTGKIRARDELIQQLFDAAAGKEGAAVIEELRARHARLVRQTAGMDVDHGGVAEEAEEAAAAAADLGDHQVILEELAATRSENQRLQEVVASLQEQHQHPQPPPTSSIPREEEERQPQPRPSPPSSKAELEALRRENAELRARLVAQEGEAGGFRKLYRAEQTERRRLFNLVQELRGNIRVLVRPRPLPFSGGAGAGEGEEEEEVCMRLVPEAGEVSMAYGRKRKCFEFDHVYGMAASQAEVYEQVAPIVRSVLDGYNACVLAYGQTGSGKTHTMMGPPEDRGVNMLALQELFARIAARRGEGVEDAVSISILEIYNESIHDLLVGSTAATMAAAEEEGVGPRKWEIKQGKEGMYVADLTTVPVASLEEVLALLAQGEGCRAKAATNLNEHSSRSHLVLSVYLHSRDTASGVATRAKLHLIDLAGSERVRKSGAEGSALKEAQAINKSLSALGDVIHARLAKAAHVPFRNSTLTYLLQDSLSGDAKVLMLVCVSPALANAEESSATLRFAERVRNVELGKASKQVVAVAPAAVAVAPPALSLDGSSGSSGFSSCDSEGPPLFSPLQQQQQQRKPPSPAINRGPRRSNA